MKSADLRRIGAMAGVWITVGAIGYWFYMFRQSPAVTHIPGDGQTPIVIFLLAVFRIFLAGAVIVTLEVFMNQNSN